MSAKGCATIVLKPSYFCYPGAIAPRFAFPEESFRTSNTARLKMASCLAAISVAEATQRSCERNAAEATE